MKCLLTGANGFLGKIISQNISKSNDVFGLSRTGSDYNFYLENDIPDFDIHFDLVIHAAGKAHIVPRTESEEQDFFRVNVAGTQNLLTGLTRSILPKHFVFISSVSVYGQKMGNNIEENFPLLATDPYGKSKIEAERIITQWCISNNIICTVLRLPLIVGSNPPGNLGAMINGIRRGYYFNIAGGKAKKSMVLAEDVAKAILQVYKIGGVYNLTDGYHPSFAELSMNISIQLGKSKPKNIPVRIAKAAANFGDLLGDKAPLNTKKLEKIVSDLTFDDTKARKTFGWNPASVLNGFKIYSNDQ